MKVLDLFSAAAGGWTLGMHRAGFQTVAACEAVEWRRILYAENNPGIPIYDDVRTLDAGQLVSDLGFLPDIIVGSPPCQDISSANTKGKGVEGERSGLFFEAVRLIGECRPRWFALENSANLRTRGADAVLTALEAIGYACWPLVVRAGDIGANHERPRCWLIGCDTAQVIDTPSIGHEGGRAWRHRQDGYSAAHSRHAARKRCQPWAGNDEGLHARLHRRVAGDTNCNRDAPDAHEDEVRQPELPGRPEPKAALSGDADQGRNSPDPACERQEGLSREDQRRTGQIPEHAAGAIGRDERPGVGQMAVRTPDSGDPHGAWPLWSLDDLAARIRLDDELPARLAGTRIAVGGPRGTAAASLIVEAYGDAVVPQIPEAIGRAILRVEAAMAAVSLPHAA